MNEELLGAKLWTHHDPTSAALLVYGLRDIIGNVNIITSTCDDSSLC